MAEEAPHITRCNRYLSSNTEKVLMHTLFVPHFPFKSREGEYMF